MPARRGRGSPSSEGRWRRDRGRPDDGPIPPRSTRHSAGPLAQADYGVLDSAGQRVTRRQATEFRAEIEVAVRYVEEEQAVRIQPGKVLSERLAD
jgi:hypothetical protein